MEQIRKLQLAQLYMMREIAQICETHGLTYYLCGGTLLGAVRHGGFIPWDDDLDITMYREDLNKLIAIMQKEHSEKYFVQTFQTDKAYTRYIPKIRLNGTYQVELNNEKVDMHKGIYIDIFPLDHVTKTGGVGLYLRGKILRLLFAYKTARYANEKPVTKVKKIIMKLVSPLTRLVPDKMMNKLFDKVCTATDKPGAKYTTSFASHYLWKRQLVSNDVYGEGTFLAFENTQLRVPSKYLALLTQVFGEDYMQLPPEEKRNSGHTLVKIDLGEYTDQIVQLVGQTKG